MTILTKIGVPFLEFLRNLTSQVLLFSIAIILAVEKNLDVTKFDIGNARNSFPFIAVMTILVAAILINFMIFLEKFCSELEWMEEESKRLQEAGIKGFKYISNIFFHFFKHGKLIIVLFITAVFVGGVSFAIVTISSVPAAVNLYNTSHGIKK